jgi:CheY-like chemotaxis protein
MPEKECASTLRILIVDDIAVNRRLLQLMLGRLGYKADMATNGREAIQALERQAYDLIFMDLQMPVLDGLRAAQTIRENLAGKEEPYIIAITAYADRFDKETCKNAGMNDYLTKPATLNDIRVAMESAQIRLKKKGSCPRSEKTEAGGIY